LEERGNKENQFCLSIVLILFPYTNLFEYKKRPAFILKITQEDLILLAIISNGFSDIEY